MRRHMRLLTTNEVRALEVMRHEAHGLVLVIHPPDLNTMKGVLSAIDMLSIMNRGSRNLSNAASAAIKTMEEDLDAEAVARHEEAINVGQDADSTEEEEVPND